MSTEPTPINAAAVRDALDAAHFHRLHSARAAADLRLAGLLDGPVYWTEGDATIIALDQDAVLHCIGEDDGCWLADSQAIDTLDELEAIAREWSGQ